MISYVAISPTELERLLKATEQPDMVSPERAAEMFSLSAQFLQTLVDEGKLKKYTVPDHGRIVRYKISELQNLFTQTK